MRHNHAEAVCRPKRRRSQRRARWHERLAFQKAACVGTVDEGHDSHERGDWRQPLTARNQEWAIPILALQPDSRTGGSQQ